MQPPLTQAAHCHICGCPCCALASLGARTQVPARCQPWLSCGAHSLGRALVVYIATWACPVSLLCDRWEEDPPAFNQDALGQDSLPLTGWHLGLSVGNAAGVGQGHGKGRELEKDHSPGLAAVPSSLGSICRCTCAEFPGPSWGKGSTHTCSKGPTHDQLPAASWLQHQMTE